MNNTANARKYWLWLFVVFVAVGLFTSLRRLEGLSQILENESVVRPGLRQNQRQLVVLFKWDAILTSILMPLPFLLLWLGNRRNLMILALVVWAALFAASNYVGDLRTALLASSQ